MITTRVMCMLIAHASLRLQGEKRRVFLLEENRQQFQTTRLRCFCFVQSLGEAGTLHGGHRSGSQMGTCLCLSVWLA